MVRTVAVLTRKKVQRDSAVYVGEWMQCPSGHDHSGEVLRKTWLGGSTYSGVEAELSCGHIVTWWF
jgi:hypothetical protein